jgi:hypothetical protein
MGGVDPVRWFDETLNMSCNRCSKPAAGVLRGPGNESYGPYCKDCAKRRLRAAYQSRGEKYDG